MKKMGRPSKYLKIALGRNIPITLVEAQQKAFQQIAIIQNPETIENFGIVSIDKNLAEIMVSEEIK